tara:strand:- start:91 stop:825 length:735 start_codon:yes stop_codon:yes gene_type:complete
MKKLIIISLLSLPMFFSSNISAEGFNDNYLQLGYSSNDYKHTDTLTQISGSAEFGNDYFITGEYSYEKGDWNDPGEYETSKVKRVTIEIGKSFRINDKNDFTSSLSYQDYENKQVCTLTNGTDCTSSYSNGGTSTLKYSNISIGIKNLISTNTEIHFENTWSKVKLTSSDLHYYTPSIKLRNISESGLESSFKYSTNKASNTRSSQLELELIKHMNENFAIGAIVTSNKKTDWTQTGIFVRRSF